MAAKGSCCCDGLGPPPYATMKAYDTSYALAWTDTRLAPVNQVDYQVIANGSTIYSVGASSVSGASPFEELIRANNPTTGARTAQSADGLFDYPGLQGNNVNLLTNGSVFWVARPVGLGYAAFNSSLVQLCDRFSGPANVTSAAMNGSDLVTGANQSGAGHIFRKKNTSGTTVASMVAADLTGGAGRGIQGYIAADGSTAVCWTSFDDGGPGDSYDRRYWRVTVGASSFTEADTNDVDGGVGWLQSPIQLTDVGRGTHVNSGGSHFVTEWPSTISQARLLTCVEVSSLSELWTLETAWERFVHIDTNNVYTVNLDTNVLSQRQISDGSVVRSCTLGWALTTTFGKDMPTGFLAVVTPGQPVTLINTTSMTILTTLDVSAHNIAYDSGYYVIVGGLRTTST